MLKIEFGLGIIEMTGVLAVVSAAGAIGTG